MEGSETKPTPSIAAMLSQMKQTRENANKTCWVLGLWVASSNHSVCRVLTPGLASLMFRVLK